MAMAKFQLNKEFDFKKIIDEIRNNKMGNVNPVKDFDAKLDSTKHDDHLRLVEQLMNTPGVGELLKSDKFSQMLNLGSVIQIDLKLAEELEANRLGTIQEITQDKSPEVIPSVSRDDTDELDTIDDKTKENPSSSNKIEERRTSQKREPIRQIDFKKTFAPLKKGEVDNPETERINEEIQEIEIQINAVETEEEKKPLIEKEKKLAKERDEKIGKFYYLTPERMLENLKNMNGGRIWKTLFNDERKRYAVERAYLTCSDPNALTNPKFLEERIGQFLPEGENVDGLKGIHKLLLASTYVGYHVEEVTNPEISPQEQEANMDKNVSADRVFPAMIDFPSFVSDMPENLKSEIRQSGYGIIKKSIEDLLLSNDIYTAMCIISDFNGIITNSLGELEANAGTDNKGNATKAYIKILEDDFRSETKKDLDSMMPDYELNFSSEDMENDSIRAQTIMLLRMIEDGGKDVDKGQLSQSVDIDIIVRDSSDVDKIKEIAQSFDDIKTQVNINYAIDADNASELRSQIESVNGSVGSNVDFFEDVATEQSLAIDQAVSDAIHTGIRIGLDVAVHNELGSLAANEMGKFLSDEIDSVFEKEVKYYAEMVNNNAISQEEAIFELSKLADVSPKRIGEILEQECERSLEEDDFNPDIYHPFENN